MTKLSLSSLSALFRKAVRRLGHDVGVLSGVRYETSFLVEILDRHGVTVAIDIGANVGQWGNELRLAGYTGRIVSFEPVSSAHALLTEQARGDSKWTVLPRLAVADTEGTAQINVASNTPMSSLLPIMSHTQAAIPGSDTVGVETVRVTTLDAMLDEVVSADDVIFVKIDVQGSERAILDGAVTSLARIAGIQLEMSFTRLYEREVNAFELYRRLDEASFAPVLFIPGYFSSELARQLQVDGVFFKKDGLG